MANEHLFFPHSEDDDLYELYEERLFEDKQFFTTKAPLPSVFERRFQKMTQRHAAFCSLTNSLTQEPELSDETYLLPVDFYENFQQFQNNRSQLFQQIYQASSVPILIFKVKNLLSLFEKYTERWQISFSEHAVLLAKEPDIVALQIAVRHFHQAGGRQIEDAQRLTFEGKEMLIDEAKRLSLWRKKELKNGHF